MFKLAIENWSKNVKKDKCLLQTNCLFNFWKLKNNSCSPPPNPLPFKKTTRFEQIEQIEQIKKIEKIVKIEQIEQIEQIEKIEKIEQIEQIEQRSSEYLWSCICSHILGHFIYLDFTIWQACWKNLNIVQKFSKQEG